MANRQTTFKLNTGASIPALGFGTWQDVDAQEAAVLEALKAGYRHIDTARVYGTEAAIGRALKKSGIPRDQIFLTTKLWNNSHHPDDVEPAIDASLKDLGLDYVDLYLMHWPIAYERGPEYFPKDAEGNSKVTDIDIVDTYKAMEKLLKAGKSKAIGVSNFTQSDLEKILKEASVVPAVNQIELHPWLQQPSLIEFHKKNDIHVTQYSPFGNQNQFYSSNLTKLIDEPILVDIGKKYNKTGAQVALAWGINHGRSVIPKSKTPERIRANFEGNFDLAPEDLERIASMDRDMRFCLA